MYMCRLNAVRALGVCKIINRMYMVVTYRYYIAIQGLLNIIFFNII